MQWKKESENQIFAQVIIIHHTGRLRSI